MKNISTFVVRENNYTLNEVNSNLFKIQVGYNVLHYVVFPQVNNRRPFLFTIKICGF